MARASSPWHNAAELRRILSELVDADWRDPRWWALVGGSSAFDVYDRARTLLRRPRRPEGLPGAGPTNDAWIGRARSVATSAAERIARAVIAARAATAAITTIDPELPHQELHGHIARSPAGHRRVTHASSRRRVVFVLPNERFIASVLPDRRSDVELARQLARALAMHHQPPLFRLTRLAADPTKATPAAVAVSLCDEHESTGRHIHRRAWSRAGGPWLGVGWSDDHELVSASRGAVSSYGHARLAAEVFGTAEGDAALLTSAARAELPGSLDLFRLPPRGAVSLGIATEHIAGPAPSLATLAYAVGIVAGEFYPRPASSSYGPVFQLPLPGGNETEPRRPLGMLSVATSSGLSESFDTFRRRIGPLLDRQRAAPQLLERLADQLARLPGGSPLRVRVRLDPIGLNTAGRSREPLFCAARPALRASEQDHLGSSAITVIPDADGYSLSISGTGFTGTNLGAGWVLAQLSKELAQLGLRAGADAIQSGA